MSVSMRRSIITVFLIAFLSGCASMTDKETTVAQGATFGAAVGAGIGAIAGGRSGAAIGALAGTLVGTVAGHIYSESKEQFASEEDKLDTRIAHSQETIDKVQDVRMQLAERIAELDNESLALTGQENSSEVRQAQLMALQAASQKKREQIATAVVTLEAEKIENEEKIAELDKEKEEYQLQLTTLDEINTDLVAEIGYLNQESDRLAQIDRRQY